MSALVRVLVVDDSAAFRELLTKLLGESPDIEVVGTAVEGRFVARKLERLRPDVITLDLHMPGTSGWTLLRGELKQRSVGVLVVSSESGGRDALEALAAGAHDVLCKPTLRTPSDLEAFGAKVRRKVISVARAFHRDAKRARLRPQRSRPQSGGAPRRRPLLAAQNVKSASRSKSRGLIAIGASTGGTVAIESILRRVPRSCPPIVITQHIPPEFSKHFARRLDSVCAIAVEEARDGIALRRGCAYIAPGDRHLLVARKGPSLHTMLSDAPPLNNHRPSVDVMFRSVAHWARGGALAVLLTGMGKDGAAGLLEIKGVGGHTIAQDRDSCVVYGMPQAAVELGAAGEVLDLDAIAEHIRDACRVRESGRGHCSTARTREQGTGRR